jgi:hypothetical protein
MICRENQTTTPTLNTFPKLAAVSTMTDPSLVGSAICHHSDGYCLVLSSLIRIGELPHLLKKRSAPPTEPSLHLNALALCPSTPIYKTRQCQALNYKLRSCRHLRLTECAAFPYFKTCISRWCWRFGRGKTRHEALWVTNPESQLTASLLTDEESYLCVR